MFTSDVTVQVTHRFAIGQAIITKAEPHSVWRVVDLDFERRYGAVYILQGVDETARMWIINHHQRLPVEQAADQTHRQHVSFVDVQFDPA